MIRSKHSGFTLIEVMLAVAIIGIVLTPLFSLQGMIAQRVVYMTQSVQRMFQAYSFYVDVQNDPEAPDKASEHIEDPVSMDVSFEHKAVPKTSDLATQFNNLSIDQVTWRWKENNQAQDAHFVSILFEPPEPPKEEKKEEQAAGQKKPAEGEAQPQKGGSKK